MPPIEAVLEENQALKGRVATLSEKVAELELQLALFKKQIFGTGKNEKQDKTQLLLKLGELESKLLAAKTATITYERREPSAPRPPAEAVFAHLPVKERIESERGPRHDCVKRVRSRLPRRRLPPWHERTSKRSFAIRRTPPARPRWSATAYA